MTFATSPRGFVFPSSRSCFSADHAIFVAGLQGDYFSGNSSPCSINNTPIKTGVITGFRAGVAPVTLLARDTTVVGTVVTTVPFTCMPSLRSASIICLPLTVNVVPSGTLKCLILSPEAIVRCGGFASNTLTSTVRTSVTMLLSGGRDGLC